LALSLSTGPFRTEAGTTLGAVCTLRDLREIERIADKRRSRTPFSAIIGKHRTIREVFDLMEMIKDSDSTVLLRGESGTGKGLFAQTLHAISPRHAQPFVKVSCAALPETLLESELFGHVRGAFTGAAHFKRGLFEEADGGTIFLDETDTLSPAMQVKLLRVLQDHQIRRLGDTAELPVDLRLIAATNRDLGEMVRRGQFRDDLFYRLNVIAISLPPLRERREDIPLLAQHFLKKYAAQEGKPLGGISREAMVHFLNHAWPGNVRELENAIERAVALGAGEAVLPEDLPPSVRGEEPSLLQQALAGPMTLAGLEKAYLIEILHRMGGHQSRAAQALGIARRTLYRKIRKYGLDRGKPAPPR
ncbi:MAG: sigma 54-interacting transcriptional regulator, partial [Deltaproteobacteria bacterium]|nr:sigma 54-interacting transcriptional regulator [Deltaproteobacteria bacterium]